MIEAVSAATDVAMPGVGIAIEQAPKVAAAPFKINSAVEAEKKRKKIDKIASEAEDTLDDDDEVVNRSAVTARAAVRRQKGNPDRLRWQSGGNRQGESELTGQHQYWSDDPPASKPETTSSVAAQGTLGTLPASSKRSATKSWSMQGRRSCRSRTNFSSCAETFETTAGQPSATNRSGSTWQPSCWSWRTPG